MHRAGPQSLEPSDYLARAVSALVSVLVLSMMLCLLLQDRRYATRNPTGLKLEYVLAYVEVPEQAGVPPVRMEHAHRGDTAKRWLGNQGVRPTGAAPSVPESAAARVSDPSVDGADTRIEIDYSGWARSVEGIEFSERRFLEEGRAGGSRPDSLRMRRSITGRDIVRGFAMLAGLWPPGYTDDPCPALRRTVEQAYNSDAPRDAAFMKDALEARDRFCS